jgi:Sister chromatid cohesion C-terminus
MNELVGNTDGFADSGCVEFLDPVSVFVQNNIFPASVQLSCSDIRPYIRCCTFSITTNSSNSYRCTELHSNKALLVRFKYVTRSILYNGLAKILHQSFPVIMALETSSVPNLSNHACALHAILHRKHTSLLNTRYTISARASFNYQRKVSPGAV